MDIFSKVAVLFDKSPQKRPASTTIPNGLNLQIFKSITKKIANIYSPHVVQFHQTFIYGQKMNILHKGKAKEMFIYLDHQRDKLLWISSKTKAFLIDLYFTAAYFKQESQIEKILPPGNKLYYFSLRHLDDEIIFIFDNEEEQSKYLNMFKVYTEELKKIDPNYSIYFSNITKMLSMHSTENGNNQHTKSQILKISEKVGLLNKKLNEEILNACLSQFGVENKKQISTQCVDYYFSIRFCNVGLQSIYEDYCKQKIGKINEKPKVVFDKKMTLQQFITFLKESQKQKDRQIQKILKKYKENLSFYDFCQYLYDSDFNNATRIQELDESYPLNDYFCYSSHNTYLSGNQLSSDCKVQRYEEDLRNGVKCVELDVHNDGGKPIVTHAFKGAGFCKPVDFQSVIKIISYCSAKSIKQSFSHLPAILSIQNHASVQNRQQMLDIMTRYFGKSLYYLQGNETSFPTLESLRGKILIKTSSNQDQVFNFKKKVLIKKKSTELGSAVLLKKDKKSQHKFQNSKLQQKCEQFAKFKSQYQNKKQKFDARISQFEQVFIPISSMAKVTSIFKSVQGINNPKPSSFVCTSLTNVKVLKMDIQQLIKYTSKSWLRTYPIGTQVNSYNYDPAPMFKVGAQIVALNTQTKDDFAWMTFAYFCGGQASNLSQRGYILKPERLRFPDKFKDMKKRRHTLTINIIQSNGYSVVIRFKGLEQDNERNNMPEKQFVYYNPDQSFIFFDFGQNYRDCVPLRFITEGYRIIQGRNRYNYLDCGLRILIHITLKIQ